MLQADLAAYSKRTIQVVALLSAFTTLGWCGPYKVLHTFQGTAQNPTSGLVLDHLGNAYGVTARGGFQDAGTVYQLSPTSGFHIIYAFAGSDGRTPEGNLIIDSAGNIYGTTLSGGKFNQCNNNPGCGTVFKLSPPSNGGVWTEATIYNFSGGTDGWYPPSGVIADSAGNLYGTAETGGLNNCGVVFELSPSGNQHWTESVLYTFSGTDGRNPIGGLTFDSAGNLYGTTELGGAFSAGTLFQLSNPQGTGWIHSVIHDFGATVGDGRAPFASLTFDASGNLFGTTYSGGDFGLGTVFELSPENGGSWTENVVHSFAGGNADGANPGASVVFDEAGNIYSTTSAGGGTPGYGTVFALVLSGNQWTEKQFSFGTGVHGGQSGTSVLLDGQGHLYGTTYSGGRAKNGGIAYGVAFRLNTRN